MGMLGGMKRVKATRLDSPPTDGSPYIADARTYDVPETIRAMIENAAPGLVAVTLRPLGGRRMIAWAERAARRRGARIIWLQGPVVPERFPRRITGLSSDRHTDHQVEQKPTLGPPRTYP